MTINTTLTLDAEKRRKLAAVYRYLLSLSECGKAADQSEAEDRTQTVASEDTTIKG